MHKTETIHHTHAQYRTHTYILFRVSFIVVLCYILLLNTPYFLLFLVVAHYFFFNLLVPVVPSAVAIKYLTRASSIDGCATLTWSCTSPSSSGPYSSPPLQQGVHEQ